MTHPKTILIAGPTASGKSALAVALAERIGGVIVNADSMQVYAELRILTARPTPAEEACVPHRLYGHVPAREAYSVARYVVDATRVVGQIHAEGRTPIIVGGTGLYLKALLEGLSPVPAIPDAIRAHWRAEGARLPPAALHAVLARRDGEMASRLDPADIQRIVRALEVLDATGRSLAEWQRQSGTPVLAEPDTLRLIVQPERAMLHRRCNARFEAMIEAGALQEVRALSAADLDPALPSMRAIGLRPLLAHLRGQIDLATAIGQGQAETRQYVKRQESWIKRYFISWTSVVSTETDYVNRIILPFIKL